MSKKPLPTLASGAKRLVPCPLPVLGLPPTERPSRRRNGVRQGQTRAHLELIAAYARRFPGTETERFRAKLVEAFGEEADALGGIRMVPDAFRIEPHAVTAVEVEITWPLSAEKLDRYIELWWALDAAGVELHLHLVSRHGVVFMVDMVDLGLECVDAPPANAMRLPGVALPQVLQ